MRKPPVLQLSTFRQHPRCGDGTPHRGPLDQFAIQRVITEYAWFVDRRDWDALVATFADTVVVDYTAMSGGDAETLSGPEQVDRWRRELGVLDGTQHVVTGVIADVTGDTAIRRPAASRPEVTAVLSALRAGD